MSDSSRGDSDPPSSRQVVVKRSSRDQAINPSNRHPGERRDPGAAPEWRVFPDASAVAEAACAEIQRLASESIEARRRFTLVLAGGSTPRATYERLARSGADMSRWAFFLGDERCLPPDDPQRNSLMARQSLIEPAGVDLRQFHPIPAELGAEAAAAQYAREIQPFLPFDCVLLGLGEDGHTASLFPGQAHPGNAPVAPVHQAPKPPPDRVTLTPPVIHAAHRVLFIIAGAGKREAVQRWRQGEPIPAAEAGSGGNAVVFVDEAAGGAFMRG